MSTTSSRFTVAFLIYSLAAVSGQSRTDGLNVLLASDANCPQGCRCEETTFDVNCRNVDFSMGDFYRLPPWTRTLTLSRASIPTLLDRSFVALRNLTSLAIQNSGLKVIQPNALMALNKLEVLQLPSNSLSKLPSTVFASIPSLKTLSLHDNLLTELPKGLFDHCQLLKSLRIDQNSIRVLPGTLFAKLPFLKEVNVASNRLQELPPNFMTSTSIKSVDASFNAIRFVSPDSLIGLPELTELKLSHNLLTHMKPVSLISAENLKRVTLDHNPFICDCQLAPLRAYWTSAFPTSTQKLLFNSVASAAVVDESISPVCAWPPQFNGMSISKLTNADFHCTTTTSTTRPTSTTTLPTTSSTTQPESQSTPPLWLLSGTQSNWNSSSLVFAAVENRKLASQDDQSSSLPPPEVIVASVASVVALLLTISLAIVILCYRRRRKTTRRQTRPIIAPSSPKRFQVEGHPSPAVNISSHVFTSTPNNFAKNNTSITSRREVGKNVTGEFPTSSSSASSSSSSGSASPPSGSTSIPSSHNCIFSTQQSAQQGTAAFQLSSDGLAMLTQGANSGLVQTVIDHLDYTNGMIIGAPQTFTLNRQPQSQHNQLYCDNNTLPPVVESAATTNNFIVDVNSLSNGVIRSESLV